MRLTHPAIRVIQDVGIVKPRRIVGLVSDVVADNIIVYNNSVSVILRALTERVYFVKSKGEFAPCPPPLPNIFSELSVFRSSLLRFLPKFATKWTSQQFVDSYTGSKRKRYAVAAEKYLLTGVQRVHAYFKTFVKAELYNATLKENPCPRIIQPRDSVYNVGLGRYLRPIEKRIYKAIDKVFGHHVVLKCDAPWDRAKTIVKYWGEFQNPVYVGLDASRFDQHVSAEALEWEHSVYNALYSSDELEQLLRWQVDNVGYATGKGFCVKYKVKGVRGSGDMNTALGNVLIMTAVTHHYLESLGIKYRFINDGDDCGVFVESNDLTKLDTLPEHHLKFGFEMEVESPCYVCEQIEFCQSRPVNLGGGWMMVRNVWKAIKHDLLTIDRDYADCLAVLKATGICGLSLYEGVPVLDQFYRQLANLQAKQKEVDRVLYDNRFGAQTWKTQASASRPFVVDPHVARVSFYNAFGIMPDYQAAMEAEFRALKSETKIYKPLFNTPLSRYQTFIHNDQEPK